MHGASRAMGAAAEAQAAEKVGTYGNVQPHTLLPFVVELPGALGKGARDFFNRCKKLVTNDRPWQDGHTARWSELGFSNYSYYHQRIAVARLRGIGHIVDQASSVLRAQALGGVGV